MSLNLTREQTIEEHQKMWRWIAENGWELYTERLMSLGLIKKYYLDKYFPNKDIKNNCFCCEYTYFNCFECPLKWKNNRLYNQCEHKDSPYRRLRNFKIINGGNITKEEFQRLALEIANLPEREEE